MSKVLDKSDAALVQWLSSPNAYSRCPDRVEHVETHISHVFLAGEYVYKLKKPLRFDFLDYSTVEARQHACREELRLNRRLAPNAYLDVMPICRDSADELRLGGEGVPVDWVVWMRRLPTELSLESLIQRNELRPEDVDRVANKLVRFYRGQTPLSMPPGEYTRRCESHVRGNRRELMSVQHHLPRGIVERVHGFQLQHLLLQPELFEQRVRAGRIVDGHGDLRPEHICMDEDLAIFDCIEFSADFRRIDVADELSFLSTECDFLGADWVGPQLIASYKSQTGDDPPPVLLDFYKSYRACVRAKVAALRADQLRGSEHEAAVSEAHRHLALADRYASAWTQPMLLVVGGLSGTGKTTLAKKLAETFGAELLRTDVIRREAFGAANSDTELNAGIYQADARQQVYERMFEQAAALISERIPVILDGTFSTTKAIQGAGGLVASGRSLFLAIDCVCRPEVAHHRIARRRAEGRDASEASPEVHDTQKSRWEEWPKSIPGIRVDTELSLDNQLAIVMDAITPPQPSPQRGASRK